MVARVLKKFFVVSITANGDCRRFDVEATCDRAAIALALKRAELREATDFDVSVRLRDSAEVADREAVTGVSQALPLFGWVVKTTSADRRISDKQYIVAIVDKDEALQAVRDITASEMFVAIGPPVEIEHLVRRQMKNGDVQELRTGRSQQGKSNTRTSMTKGP